MKNQTKTIKLNQGDIVLQEMYRIKDELSASYGHDVDKLFEETRKHEKLSKAAGWKFAPLPQSQEAAEPFYALREEKTKQKW